MDIQFSIDAVHCRISQWGRIKTMPGKNYLTPYKVDERWKVRIANKEFDLAELVLTHHGRPPKEHEVLKFRNGDPDIIHIRNL